MELINLHRQFQRYCSIEEGLAIRTVKAMRTSFGTLLRRTKIERLADLTEDVVREFFYEGVEIYHWSPSHYSNHYKYLKRFLEWCLSRGLIKQNPIKSIKKPKLGHALPRRLTEEEAQKILYTSMTLPWRYEFEQIRNHAILATFLFSGLRMNELLNLETVDFDNKSRNLFIRKGKGNKDRLVPVHYKLNRTLSRFVSVKQQEGAKTSIWLFHGRHGGKLTAKNLGNIFKRIGKKTDIRFTAHQLRHTFASMCIEQGMGIVQLKEILGHSNLASTMIYLKMSTKNLSESLNKLELF